MADKEHLYTKDFITPVALATGLSKDATRKVIVAFCHEVGDSLAKGSSTITLTELGRFKASTIPSYWTTDFNGKRRAQLKFKRIYYSPSQTIMRRLNNNLHKSKKEESER
jgi:nucleoid DNA-binding protein